MNASLFVHRNPDAPHMYGTTSLEAFMLQLKSFFRNVFHQTRRNALIVCKIATMSKIFGAYARTALPGMNVREHEALLSFCQNLLACDVDVKPKLRIKMKANPRVVEAELPPSAKRLRKH